MFEQKTQRGELPTLSSGEEWCDAIHVADAVFGAGLQEHLTDVQVVSANSFL